MSNQSERRHSKRLAVTSVYDETDGDFQFTRGSKRAKTASSDAEPAAPAPAPKKVGRPPKQSRKRAPSPAPAAELHTPVGAPAPRRSSRRISGQDDAQPVPAPPALQLVVAKTRTTRLTTRDKAPEDEPAPPAAKGRRVRSVQDDRPDLGRGTTAEVDEREPAKKARRREATAPEKGPAVAAGQAAESQQILLPFSDTPIINRNKEMRKNGGGGDGSGRRSSLGLRGRRASSLIANGHSAMPHREVEPTEYYKHIEADGLSEPRRMRQLLTWCGERELIPKPPHGTHGSRAVLGARYIQDLLLKDFKDKAEFSDWFSREEAPKAPVVLKPNPRNIEHEAKIVELETKIKRLKEEKKAWKALAKPLPDVPLLYPGGDPTQAPDPDVSMLDPDEAAIFSSLTDPDNSFKTLRKATQDRVRALRAAIEFKIDHLASNIHTLDLRVTTGGREADKILALSADRLKEREEKEKTASGTRDLPTMEVLRSLSRLLPEEGG